MQDSFKEIIPRTKWSSALALPAGSKVIEAVVI